MNLPDLTGKVVINNSQAKAALSEIGKEATSGLASALSSGAAKATAALSLVAAGAGVVALQLKNMAENGRTVSQVSEAFKSLAAAQKQSYEMMLSESRKATRGLVSDFELMAAGNKAMLLGLPVTAREMAILSGASVTLGQAMNQGPTKSLNDLITGLSRGSAQILDNLGIVVKASVAHEAYATSIGKAAKDLTEAEKKTAVYTAAIKAMSENVEKLGGVQTSLASRMDQVRVMWENVTNAADVAVAQSPVLNAAMGAIAEKIQEAYGPGPQGIVAGMTDYMNRFGLGAIQVAEWAVTAYQTIKLGLIGLAQVAAATNPFTMFSKALKESLVQMEADTKASFASQMNSLTVLNERMKKAIEDSHANQNKSAGNPLAGAGSGGGRNSGLDSQAAAAYERRRAADQKFAEEDYELWKKFYDDLGRLRMEANKDFLEGPEKSTKASMPGLDAASKRWLKDAADLIGEQDSAQWPVLETVTKIKTEQEKAAETAARWAGALQGVALMAGSIGGKLGDTLSVMANIGKSFEGWDDKDKNAKFNAIAGGVGQIGGLIGGKAGGGLQGAAGGAMAGFAIGGPWGAAIGGVAGGIMGLFGASKAQKAELADAKIQLQGLSETAQKFGIDLTKAFSSKSVTEVKQAISDVGKAVEDQKKRLAGLDVAGGGLNAFTKGGGLSDAASVDRGGLYAGAIFGGMVKETGDVVGALKAIGPALAEMSTKAAEFGVSLSPGVSNLLGMNDVIAKNEGLADQVSGLNSMMKGLGEAGMVTKDLFAAFGADTSAVFARLVEGGATGNQALSLMQPTLQQLYEGQKLHGFAVDQTTQGLIDQAKAEGIVGEQFMSANERIVELLGIIAEVLGAKLPEAYGKAGDAAEEYGRRATNSAPKFPNGGGINPGGGDPEDSGLSFAGGTGFRNFGSGTRVTLHGDEAVLTRPQADRLVGMAVAGVPGSYQPTTGGGGGIQIGEVHVHANNAQGGQEAADAFLARIAEALDQGGPGASRFRTAQGGRSNL